MNKLTPAQRSTFEVLVKKTRDMHERNRLCVILARDDGLEPNLIAQVLRLSIRSVYDYLSDYQTNEKIKHDTKGGTESKLSKKQSEELLEHLSKYTYRKVKDICAHVLKEYKITYTVGGMTSWLRKNNFVFKSPVKVPGKLDLEKQTAFVEEYRKLKTLLSKDEEIYFSDAVHPDYQSQSVCGWIRKGVKKRLRPQINRHDYTFLGH